MFWVNFFFCENFFVKFFLGEIYFWVKIFGVKIFGVKFFWVNFFSGENFLGDNFLTAAPPPKEGGGVRGVTGVVRLTRGRYPPSYLECLSHKDSENIAHC